MMQMFCQIDALSLSGNCDLGEKGISLVAGIVKNFQVSTLDLSSCKLSLSQCEALRKDLPETVVNRKFTISITKLYPISVCVHICIYSISMRICCASVSTYTASVTICLFVSDIKSYTRRQSI